MTKLSGIWTLGSALRACRIVTAALAAFAGAGILMTAARAEEPKKDWALTGSIGATTDYVFRGFSQTAEKPTVQGTVDFTYKMFYAGMFLSGVDFVGNVQAPGVATAEIDYYAGVKFPVGPVEFDFGGIYYTYPGANDKFAVTGFRELDYFEFKAGAKYKPLAAMTLGLFAYYSPEYTNKTGKVATFEGTFEYAFSKVGSVTPAFSALLGYQVGDNTAFKALVGNGDDNYVYWNAGLTLGFGDNFSLDFRYWDTNIANSAGGFSSNFCNNVAFQCNERFVATAKVTF
jgi:uncharacterized protein (TIGR02001 family)